MHMHPRLLPSGLVLMLSIAVAGCSDLGVKAPLPVNVVAGCSAYLPVAGGGSAVIAPGTFITVSVLFNPLTGGPFPCDIAVGPGIPSVSVTGFATTVSLANDIQPIFDSSCISCHPPNNGMDLTRGVSYGNLVNGTSFGYAPA